MKIAFWDNQLCERGTTVALFDYAYYNQTLLNNQSFIFYEKSNPENNPEVVSKFSKLFPLFPVNDFNDVDDVLRENGITHLYIIKFGVNDGKISKVAKNCIHCVFSAEEPHGDVYTTIHRKVYGNHDGKYPIVPHMINLPHESDNMRRELNIPEDAIVFGGYGGRNNFSIEYVQELVYEIASSNPNIYFLFANFLPFCEKLPNIIHLPTIVDMREKVRFINTCDAKLWARLDGETFGLAIGEFCCKNKPVICTGVNVYDISHVDILKDKAMWYTGKDDLREILLNFNKEKAAKKDWNGYSDYTPEKVMKIFKETFLD